MLSDFSQGPQGEMWKAYTCIYICTICLYAKAFCVPSSLPPYPPACLPACGWHLHFPQATTSRALMGYAPLQISHCSLSDEKLTPKDLRGALLLGAPFVQLPSFSPKQHSSNWPLPGFQLALRFFACSATASSTSQSTAFFGRSLASLARSNRSESIEASCAVGRRRTSARRCKLRPGSGSASTS